jgi:cytoskeletal protein RodZ
MTALLSLFSGGAGVGLLGIAAAIIAGVYAMFKHQQTNTIKAQLQTAAAVQSEQADIAASATASAAASQQALSAVTDASASRVATDAAIPAAPAAVEQALVDEGFAK